MLKSHVWKGLFSKKTMGSWYFVENRPKIFDFNTSSERTPSETHKINAPTEQRYDRPKSLHLMLGPLTF